MTDDQDDNVLLFPRSRDDAITPPVDRKPKPRSYTGECVHRRQLVLDEEAHQLRCGDCAQVLDPFDWMIDHVGKWNRANTDYRQARQQAAVARKELADLERKVKNRRAAARRPGVLLTSGDARALRDQFQVLERLVVHLVGTREQALRQAHLFGWDPERVSDAYRRLTRAVDLTEPDEATA